MSTQEQDLTVQRQALERLGVSPDRVYTDRGLTGTNRERPGLREALAACRDGDTFVVTKLDRLARSLRDARDIVDELTARKVKLNLGGSIHDPNDPVGRLLFNVLAIVAVAKAKGRLKGRQPKLSPSQQSLLAQVHAEGTHTIAELADLFNVSRATVYRAIQRTPAPARAVTDQASSS